MRQHPLLHLRICVIAFVLAICLPFAGAGGGGQPQTAPDRFHFAIIGDRTGTAVPGVYEQVWREVSLLHPEFAITVGDAIQGGDDARAEDEWREVKDTIREYARVPVYFTPGNHDIWSDESRSIYEQQTGRASSYSFDYRNAHFTILDNSRSDTLGEDQVRFLEADLKAHAERKPKFVFLHKPFWVMFLKLGSGDFALHRIARQYGVDYVISGHAHQFFQNERDGIVYIAAGSSGASIARGLSRGEGFEQGWFYQHLWVTVDGNKAYITVNELGDPNGKGRMFSANGAAKAATTF